MTIRVLVQHHHVRGRGGPSHWVSLYLVCVVAAVSAYACSDGARSGAHDERALRNTTGSGGASFGGVGTSELTSAVDEELGGASGAGSRELGGERALPSNTRSLAGTASGGTDVVSASGGFHGGTHQAAGGSRAATTSGSSDCAEFVMPTDCTVASGAVLPSELRCTGLYEDWTTRTLRCGVRAYTPAHELWSDAAAKQRYVWLPPGAIIDVSNPDDWAYPVGTRFWKEFRVGPEGQQRLGETRYLLKVKGGWIYTTYIWSEDAATAVQHNEGVDDLFGTGHGVPSREQCKTCHIGRPDFVLGWDFIMLGAGAKGVTMLELANEGKLGGLKPEWLDLKAPGDELEQPALTYMHANCGISCHNQTPKATGNPSGLFLRLEVGELDSVFSTDAVLSGMNRVPSPNANYEGIVSTKGDFYDFRPLDPERSLALARMAYRGSVSAMPPIGSHQVHPDGIAAVEAWVESMTEDRGYPPPAP